MTQSAVYSQEDAQDFTNSPAAEEMQNAQSNTYHIEATRGNVQINGVTCSMLIDGGSGATILNEPTARLVFGKNFQVDRPNSVNYNGYGGSELKILGNKFCTASRFVIDRTVTANNLECSIVEGGNKPNLLGRDWMRVLGIRYEDFIPYDSLTSAEQGELPECVEQRGSICAVSNQDGVEVISS